MEDVSESVLYNARRWHGKIGDQFTAIDNLVRSVVAHHPAWAMPVELFTQLTGNHDRVQALIEHCRTLSASGADRQQRNSLLKATVNLCVQQVKMWAYGKYSAGELTAADGKTEIYREITTRLHNDVRMPEGSRGKQFVARAAFLKHVNDEPRFGNEPTFSMPLTTNDLLAALDRQHHEDFEEHVREVERLRQEIEHLRAELHSRQ